MDDLARPIDKLQIITVLTSKAGGGHTVEGHLKRHTLLSEMARPWGAGRTSGRTRAWGPGEQARGRRGVML